MKCDYGYGRDSIHQFKNGKWCCSQYYTSFPKMRINVPESWSKRLLSQSKSDWYPRGLKLVGFFLHSPPPPCPPLGYHFFPVISRLVFGRIKSIWGVLSRFFLTFYYPLEHHFFINLLRREEIGRCDS